MVSETLELIIRTSGAGSAANDLDRMGLSARNANSSLMAMNDTLSFMRKTLVALSFLRLFEGVAAGISQVQQMNNQLQQIAKTAADIPKAFAMFADVALKTHAPVEAVVGLGVQIGRSSAAYKASAQDIADATETIFNTFRLSGSDPTTIRNVTKDLKEIFSLGVVQGRQFRAVILQDQAEALLLAKYIHATGADAAGVNKELDSIRAKGQLPDIYETAMKHKGAFTGADVMRANIAAKPEISDKAAQTVTTLGQAFTDFYTRWLLFLNTLSDNGVFKPIVDFVEYLSKNLPSIAVFLLAIGTAIGSLYAISTATALFQKFFLLIKSDAGAMVLPFILLGVIIAGIFGPQMAKAAKDMGGWTEFIIRNLAIDISIIQTLFGNMGTVIKDVFVVIGNAIIATIQFIINKIIDGLNFLSSKLNTLLPQGMQIGQINQQNLGSIDNPYQTKLQEEFKKHLTENYSFLEKNFNSKGVSGTPELKQPAPGGGEGAGAVRDQAKAARDGLQSLIDMLAKFAGPAVKFEDDISKMTTKVKDLTTGHLDAKGKIVPALLSMTQVEGAFADAGFKGATYQEQFTKFTQAAAREVMGLKNTDIELVHAQDMANAALKIGAVTAGEAAEYVHKATVANELYNLSLQKTIEAGIQIAKIKFDEKKESPSDIASSLTTKALAFNQEGDINTYNTQLATLNQLMASGTISNEAYVKTLNDIQKAYLSTKTDAMSGFQSGLIQIQETMFNTSTDAAKVMTDSFQGLQDSLVNFATTGKLSFSDMAASILRDMDSLIIKQTIMQPLMSALGMGPGTNAVGGGGGGIMSMLGSMFGGDKSGGGGLGGLLGGQPGSSVSNPMYVTMVPGIGDPGSVGGVGGLFDDMGAGTGGGAQGWSGLFGSGAADAAGAGAGAAGAASSGGFMAFLQSIGSLFGFAGGGDFLVGGSGGTDSQLVAFRASPDERVSVQTPQQQRDAQKANRSPMESGGLHVHLHGVEDYDSFKRSKSQLAAGIGMVVNRSSRRNGN